MTGLVVAKTSESIIIIIINLDIDYELRQHPHSWTSYHSMIGRRIRKTVHPDDDDVKHIRMTNNNNNNIKQ